jgi:hypothetical protein
MRILLLTLVFLSALAAAPPPEMKAIHKVFVQKMDNDLDQYLRAELTKQFKGKVVVVAEKADADGILAGGSQMTTGAVANVTGRVFNRDLASGTILLLDKDEKTVLWSDHAGDSAAWYQPTLFSLARRGQEIVASRLIKKLKKAMGY